MLFIFQDKCVRHELLPLLACTCTLCVQVHTHTATHISDYLYARGKWKIEGTEWVAGGAGPNDHVKYVLGQALLAMCMCFFPFLSPSLLLFSLFACPHAGTARTSTKAEHIKSCTLGNPFIFRRAAL